MRNDTVAAVSTPFGKGGVAMIRVSGDEAHAIAQKVFLHNFEQKPQPNFAYHGRFFDDRGVFDDGLVIFYAAPRSYTGEDTVELCCHGGVLVTRRLLEAVLAAGASPAGAGEFTKRAFLNGKLTLSEAEAVGGIIDAQTDAAIEASSMQLSGALSREIEAIHQTLTHLAASVYAYIDYPDEDMTDIGVPEMQGEVERVLSQIKALLRTGRYGKAISEGIVTGIVGRPNTGKSSLLNRLCGEERAIVTDLAGTTRDVVTCKARFGNVLLDLADTAGIRASDSLVEQLGIAKSKEILTSSNLILFVMEAGKITAQDRELAEMLVKAGQTANTIAVYNKADLAPDAHPEKLFPHEVLLSARTGIGMEALEAAVNALSGEAECAGEKIIITSARQLASLRRAEACLQNALKTLESLTQDMALADLEEAISALAELDGRQVSEAIVSEIFGHFCVGK